MDCCEILMAMVVWNAALTGGILELYGVKLSNFFKK